MPPKPVPSPSGIQVTKDGQRVIPASVRADGSVRSQRLVRQGYTPAEDIAVYKNEKAESFRSHQFGHKDYVPPGLVPKVVEAGDKKKRRRPKIKEGEQEQGAKDEMEDLPAPNIGQEDLEKKARALRKKIRQAMELKERAGRGEKLEDSQISKIGMLETFEKELASLDINDWKES